MGAPKSNGVRNEFWRPWISTSLPWLGPGRKSGKKICSFGQCDKEFERESELKRHISSKHKKISDKCPKCDETFTRKDNLTRHVNHKHNEGSELGGVKPICAFCFKRLSRKDAVSRHQQTCPKNPLRHSSVMATPPQSPTAEGSLSFQSFNPPIISMINVVKNGKIKVKTPKRLCDTSSITIGRRNAPTKLISQYEIIPQS